MNIELVYVTFPTREAAKALGQSILVEGLAACVNVHSIDSQYIWKGVLEVNGEFVAIFKTNASHEPLLREQIEKGHPYEVPCILSWSVRVNDAYAEWINSCLIEL